MIGSGISEQATSYSHCEHTECRIGEGRHQTHKNGKVTGIAAIHVDRLREWLANPLASH